MAAPKTSIAPKPRPRTKTNVGLPSNRLVYDVEDITRRGPEGKIKRDAAKKRVLEKYNLEGARSGWKVSSSKLGTILANLPTNVRLLTEFMLGKDKPISINDFTKDELASIIALSEEQQENYKNVQNRKLKNQPENVTTVDGYDTTQPYRFSKWIENSPYFRTLAFTLTDPNYQTRTTLGRYDTEETPSSIIIKDAYDMNIKQRDLPNPFGGREELSKVLEEVRSNPEVAGEFLANIIKPNPEDSRKFDLVIPKRKPDQPSPRDTAYQAPMQLKEKPKDNPRIKEEVPEGFDILKFDKGGDVAAQTDNLFGYTDEAVTKEVDKYKEDVNTELSFKDAATFVAEATPIIGDALAAKEVYDELQKDDPNYLLVGALGGAALVGFIPGLGDAAAKAIKTGAKKALDTAKRIEVDSNTLGSMGGNINLTPKAANSPDEPKIISFTKKKEDKELENFNANLMSSISEQASKQAKLVGELQEAGVYGDYQKGVRVQSQNYKGEALPPYTITGLSLNKVKLNNPNLKRTEDRLGIKFEYIEKDGDYYLPMLSVEQADGGKSQVYLDALKQRNTPIMDGPKDFNKGGAVMNEQMEMAFMQEGGLKDDGMDQDPVSGNEVPSGSMASEVRDDISAQLSEGEYVVPADVVRFFGVKFFEDLRMEAKMGLQSMEANGRIGGEPVAAPQEGTLSDEEFAMLLQKELQMAEGGMVPEMDQTMGTPAPIKAAEGKYIPGQMPTFNPRAFGLGFSMTPGYTPPPVAGTEPTVETEASCAARDLVYNPDTKMCEVPLPTVLSTRDDDSIVPKDEGEDSSTWMDSYDYTDFDNLAQQTSAALDGPTSVIGGVAELLLGGGVLGKFAKASNAAQVAANIAVLKAQGQDVSALTDKFNSYIKDNNLTEFKNFITGKELAKQINATQIDVGLFKDSTDVFGNKIFKTDEEFNKQMEKVAPKGMTYQPAKDDNDTGAYVRPGSAAPSSSPRPEGGFAAAKAAAKAASNKDPGPSGAEVAKAAAAKATKKAKENTSRLSPTEKKGGASLDKAYGISGLSKGGLMNKKKK